MSAFLTSERENVSNPSRRVLKLGYKTDYTAGLAFKFEKQGVKRVKQKEYDNDRDQISEFGSTLTR